MADSTKFVKLFEPGTIGKLKIKNRIVRTAAGVDFYDPQGILKLKQELPMIEAFARGGAGLIIISAARTLWMQDKVIPGYAEVTKASHKYGVPIFANLHHGGAWLNRPREVPPVVSASAIPLDELKLRGPDFPMVPKEMTVPEIKDVVDMFASASEKLYKAGFDGIEVNAATCHLANAFLSRAWNRRHDEYGCQSFENRARFVVEIKDEIQRRIGKDAPIGLLMNGGEFGIKDGLTSEESQGLAKIFEKAGFAYLHVRVYGYMDYYDLHLPDSIFFPEPPELIEKPLDTRHQAAGISTPLAAAVKKAVSTIPVMTVGKMDAKLGEEILERGDADFIAIQRRIIADPDYPNKVAAGKLDDVKPCIFCLRCWGTDYPVAREDTKCSVNGAIGGEEDYVIPPAPKKKKVMVIGAGPGGMEAARVAAVRGHEVTLYEKGKKLGGLIPLASMVKGFEVEDLEGLMGYYKLQLAKLGVQIKLGTEVNVSLVEQNKPDAVVVATGGAPTVPQIPGINGNNVLTMPDLHRRVKGYLDFFGPRTLRSLTRFYLPVGKRVIVMGGRLQGCEVAEFMVKRGREVTLVDTAKSWEDERLPRMRTLRLSRWFAKKGVKLMTEVKYEEITDKGLTITTKDGKRQTLEADSIIPVMPLAPSTELVKSLQGKVPEVYSVGDCREPRLIREAIGDGYRTARHI
ncbi:MAG: NAD(P)/FAD-dependent oxidoreductase [Chloroflexota bacterium]